MVIFKLLNYEILCEPCPFCDSKKLDISKNKNGFQVECYKCNASGPIGLTPEEAVKKWCNANGRSIENPYEQT